MVAERQGWTIVATIAVIGTLLALPALTAGCGSWGGQEPAGPSPTSEALISEQQVMELVDTTCAAIEKDAAGTLAAIDAGEPPYTDPANPELYAFVYDRQVTLVATPDSSVRGQNMKGKPDAAGTMFRDEIVAGAIAHGGGSQEYVYKEPGKEGLFVKSTYYRLVTGGDGKDYVVCAGRYLRPFEGTPQAGSSPSAAAPSKGEVVAFVDEARKYARQHSKQEAIAEFMKTSGRFFRGELYIFAYDFKGKVLCLPAEPQKVGEDRWGLQDSDGVYFVREFVDTARDPGAGWVSYKYVNPAQGYQVQQKTSYVRKVDDTWLIGAGTYRPAD